MGRKDETEGVLTATGTWLNCSSSRVTPPVCALAISTLKTVKTKPDSEKSWKKIFLCNVSLLLGNDIWASWAQMPPCPRAVAGMASGTHMSSLWLPAACWETGCDGRGVSIQRKPLPVSVSPGRLRYQVTMNAFFRLKTAPWLLPKKTVFLIGPPVVTRHFSDWKGLFQFSVIFGPTRKQEEIEHEIHFS